MTAAIQAMGLAKRFGETTAVACVDLEVEAGTVLGLLGPNGAGKTTVVRMLATLLGPDAGQAFVHGHDVTAQADRVREIIGLTGQFAAVDDGLTGIENLLFLGRLLGIPRSQARETARSLLDRFSLTDAADRPAKTYSGGMRRRLDLAACLVGRPKVIFLDEPTTGLDPHARDELWEIIRGEVGRGVTVLLTTQYLEEADQLADDIVVLNQGSVVAQGTPQTLKQEVGRPTLQVRPLHGSDLARTAEVVTQTTGEHTLQGRLVKTRVHDTGALSSLARALEDAGIEVAELSIREPSLDEVFKQLTVTGATV
ncbi:ATP-binding cassette domain-containing protein [Streptomyces tubbatahanensis]|uniref:ATP-binding cassette domain-containing protein n=1 Tax=Streptomyces tubbatahanensis TaxID=2923272 RepID=A0ABY3Y282_9ACTN|nr:ATP-binding cassette domain-containing protein [Streptomyces tubbatahanensis]UNT00806.1 ATP-binding cassette domain-containing protein [Streptomyces tubbatahanensis]